MTKPVKVWAHGSATPGHVCEDARLRAEDGDTEIPYDQPQGQAGWDVGINFTTSNELIARLEKLKEQGKIGEIKELAIHVHGKPGKADLENKGVHADRNNQLTAERLAEYKQFLQRVRKLMPANGGKLIFMGCLTGQGQEGAELLKEVSKQMPNVHVVAFETVGYAPGGSDVMRPGEKCTEPGMRSTDKILNSKPGTDESTRRETEWAQLWRQLQMFPWASWNLPYAVVATNGFIQKHGKTTRPRPKREYVARVDRKAQAVAKTMDPRPGKTYLPVELREDEALVYNVLPMDLNAPVPLNQVSVKAGLSVGATQRAITGLSRHGLIMRQRRGETAGWVRIR